MKVTLRKDINPDPEFYYHQQYEIYHEPYLIWDLGTWAEALKTCDVFRLEIDGRYGGDIILEDRGHGAKYIVDFSILPDFQGKGIGRSALEYLKKMTERQTAVTRKETLGFFLRSGFVLRKRLKNYYYPGVDGYYVVFGTKAEK